MDLIRAHCCLSAGTSVEGAGNGTALSSDWISSGASTVRPCRLPSAAQYFENETAGIANGLRTDGKLRAVLLLLEAPKHRRAGKKAGLIRQINRLYQQY